MYSASAEEVPDLTSLNGPFQLSEYLSLMVKHDPHDVKALVEIPKTEGGSGKAPERNVVSCALTRGDDADVQWIYEHLR